MSDSRRLTLHLIGSSIVMIAAIWLASGTLAPYAATLPNPTVLGPCHYLANLDQSTFRATFAMLDGRPAREWSFSVVLRRILYPIVAYPLMKGIAAASGDFETGYMFGGLLTTMLIHVAALAIFSWCMFRRYGLSAAVASAWLIATYPGITYWAGLPYSYVTIVPLSLLSALVLMRIEEATTQSALAGWSLLLGVFFTGYDLLPYFGTAAILIVARRRDLRSSVINVVPMLLPSLVIAQILAQLPELPRTNSNTAVYGTIVRAYLHPQLKGWGALLLKFPAAVFATFFFSNFVILPAAWLAVAAWRRRGSLLFERAELAIVLSIGAVFLFNNLAPPYDGWQLRGDWIVRLYQPLFVVFILGVSRLLIAPSRARVAFVLVVVLANASIALGPIASNPLSFRLYERFYRHASPGQFERNLALYGKRPLGVCGNERSIRATP